MLGRIIRFVWNEDRSLRVIHLLGLAMVVLTYAIVIGDVVLDATVLWQQSPVSLASDVARRLAWGLFFSLAAGLPYGAASLATLRTGRSKLFATMAGLVWVAHVALTLYWVAIAPGPIGAVAMFFFPFYLVAPVVLVWALYAMGVLARRS